MFISVGVRSLLRPEPMRRINPYSIFKLCLFNTHSVPTSFISSNLYVYKGIFFNSAVHLVYGIYMNLYRISDGKIQTHISRNQPTLLYYLFFYLLIFLFMFVVSKMNSSLTC